jgi:N-acetylmuramic acid 6-phosphate etherase
MDELIITERRNPRTADIDELPTLEVVTRINDEDRLVAEAVRARLPEIAALADAVAGALKAGGRLIYAGAGSSGRLGALDAAECPPTYSADPSQVVALIAGGERALRAAVEGAEDDEAQGASDASALGVGARDVLVGIAASGRTPYTIGAMRQARAAGATVGCVVNTPGSEMEQLAHHPIVVPVGPEVIAGSTRMKSGTAQKLVLNSITTAAMIRLGKVYGNLMVDLQPTNRKLARRALTIVREATGAGPDEARAALAVHGSAKAAIFALLSGLSAAAVRQALAAHGGRLKDALRSLHEQ